MPHPDPNPANVRLTILGIILYAILITVIYLISK